MGILNLFGSKEERYTKKYEKIGNKAVIKQAYEEEKEKVMREREIEKKKRAAAKLRRSIANAKRDARNPKYKRLAKKIGASSKEAASKLSAEIGKAAAKKKAQMDIIKEDRKKARLSEMSKLAVQSERAKVRAKAKRPSMLGFGGSGQRPRLEDDMPDVLGMNQSKNKQGTGYFSESSPLGNTNSGSDILGLSSPKNKKKGKKPDYFGDLL